MKNVKKKSVFSRMISLMAVVLSLSLVLAFTAVSASAAEAPADVITTVQDETETEVQSQQQTVAEIFAWNPSIVAHAEDAGGGGEGGGTGADTSYQTVMGFFIKWIRRIGAAVALIGGIMFGLAIKDNNADQKQAGLMTMIAGFIVVAITAAVDMFELYS